jgi:threonyl-tRNA synthetase
VQEGRDVFWHSSAHILGHAMEMVFGGWLTIGPPVDDGFYYDMYTGEDACGKPRSASDEDFAAIEKYIAGQVAKKGQGMYNRIEVTKDQALEMFGYNKFKVEMINELMAAGTTTTVYRIGDFVDLCRGPHIATSKNIVAMKCTKLGASYWRGSADNDSLQRVYGVAFPDKKQMTAWKLRMEEAKKRDHRLLGVKQSLFFFNPISPGSCFFQPHGARLYNTLVNFIKQQYWLRGYDEVITPNMFSLDLWEISGHAAKYKDDMFLLDVEKQTFGLKPMNCPGHCMMFRERARSYRELPMRYADFGVLHRNELSGALSGLTRVRRFQQDDAHIFCTLDQVSKEVLGVLQFVEYVYDIFGMTFNLMLSTRPATAIGDVKLWDAAEASLAEALNEFCGDKRKQGVDPGGGAFYGPKIDIQVTDALGRPHQCATVQLDFQLPLRFDLQYQGPPKGDGTAGVAERPVIRASGQRRCLVHIIVDTYIYNIIGLYEHSILSSAPSRAAAHQPKTRIDSSSHTSVP